jgi:hypothetical protein
MLNISRSFLLNISLVSAFFIIHKKNNYFLHLLACHMSFFFLKVLNMVNDFRILYVNRTLFPIFLQSKNMTLKKR